MIYLDEGFIVWMEYLNFLQTLNNTDSVDMCWQLKRPCI